MYFCPCNYHKKRRAKLSMMAKDDSQTSPGNNAPDSNDAHLQYSKPNQDTAKYVREMEEADYRSSDRELESGKHNLKLSNMFGSRHVVIDGLSITFKNLSFKV
ncbi:putative 11-kDa protein [Citrus virus B]|nr:putative 11-kDa protein [Citrus virus B]